MGRNSLPTPTTTPPTAPVGASTFVFAVFPLLKIDIQFVGDSDQIRFRDPTPLRQFKGTVHDFFLNYRLGKRVLNLCNFQSTKY